MRGKTMTNWNTTHTLDALWDKLTDLGVSEQTLQIVTSIDGYNTKTMLDILYAHTGYRTFEQLEETE